MPRSVPPLPAVPMGDRIPRLLHQHFLTGEAAIPGPIRAVRDSLRAANPGWEYRFWDAPRAEAFIAVTYGEAVLSSYLRIRPEYYAARSDLLRYLVGYAQGGVYLDIKCTCDRPLDAAIKPEDRFLLLNYPHMIAESRSERFETFLRDSLPEIAHLANGEYVQWVIVTVPGHPFLKAVIRRVLANIDEYSPLRYGTASGGTLRLTGPIPYSLEIERLRHDHPCSQPMSSLERGFHYSGLGGPLMQHRKVFGAASNHDLETPIVAGSAAAARIARVLRRLTRNETAARHARRLRRILIRR